MKVIATGLLYFRYSSLSYISASMAFRRACFKQSHAEHCTSEWRTSLISPLSQSILAYIYIYPILPPHSMPSSHYNLKSCCSIPHSQHHFHFTLYLQNAQLSTKLHTLLLASSWITSASRAYPLSIHLLPSSKQQLNNILFTSASINSLIVYISTYILLPISPYIHMC